MKLSKKEFAQDIKNLIEKYNIHSISDSIIVFKNPKYLNYHVSAFPIKRPDSEEKLVINISETNIQQF
jgi:hypothetical protein